MTELRFRKLAEWLVAMSEKEHDLLPKNVSDMTSDEYKIFEMTAKYLGQLQFLTREAQLMLSMGEERYQDHKDAEKIKTLEWTIGVKDKQIVNLTEAHEAIVNKLAQALGHITMADTLEDAVDIAMTALNGPPEPTGETMTYDEIFVKLCELRYAATTVLTLVNKEPEVSRSLLRVTLGETGTNNGSFIIWPMDDSKSERQTIWRRLLEVFKGIDNVKIERGTSMPRAS
jgi:hypothetical protein